MTQHMEWDQRAIVGQGGGGGDAPAPHIALRRFGRLIDCGRREDCEERDALMADGGTSRGPLPPARVGRPSRPGGDDARR